VPDEPLVHCTGAQTLFNIWRAPILWILSTIKVEKLKIKKLLGSFIINNDLPRSFLDVLIACIIFLTRPITVVGSEQSFSNLKLIKIYLKNTCGQERLVIISILNIEKERTETLNIEKVIDNFANAKSRKIIFLKQNILTFYFSLLYWRLALFCK